MKTDLEILSENSPFRPAPAGGSFVVKTEPAGGSFVVKTETMDQPAGVVTQLLNFGGEGWLWCADRQELILGTLQGKGLSNAYPLAGEFHRIEGDQSQSLHLRQGATGWVLTTYTLADATDKFITEQQFLSQDPSRQLKYQILWEPSTIGDHAELRPTATRFVGFAESGN